MKHTKNKKDTIGNLLVYQKGMEYDDKFHYRFLDQIKSFPSERFALYLIITDSSQVNRLQHPLAYEVTSLVKFNVLVNIHRDLHQLWRLWRSYRQITKDRTDLCANLIESIYLNLNTFQFLLFACLILFKYWCFPQQHSNRGQKYVISFQRETKAYQSKDYFNLSRSN